jgi:hypothetical protein
MAKLALTLVLLPAGCLFAGVYGAAHDQVSYSVSPDYYHAYKFDQFEVPEGLRDRRGAAIVGWEASWWMGLFVGVPVLLLGLALSPGWREYLTRSLVAFGIAAATALVAGLGALLWASLTITKANLPAYHFPPGVLDKVAFARAGAMHNFSYLGGFLGILTASTYLVIARWRAVGRGA